MSKAGGSQQPIYGKGIEGSDDVYIHKFTISLGGKTLFSDCKLSLAYGHRYGLVGARQNAHKKYTA